jgi:hypothetical protein
MIAIAVAGGVEASIQLEFRGGRGGRWSAPIEGQAAGHSKRFSGAIHPGAGRRPHGDKMKRPGEISPGPLRHVKAAADYIWL